MLVPRLENAFSAGQNQSKAPLWIVPTAVASGCLIFLGSSVYSGDGGRGMVLAGMLGGMAGGALILALILGMILASIIFSVVNAAADTIIVLFAEAPSEFQQNHPTLAIEMNQAWTDAYPDMFSPVGPTMVV